MYSSTVRMLFYVFCAVAFVIIGIEVAELRVRLDMVDAKADSALAFVESVDVKTLRLEDERVAKCEEFASRIFEEIMAKRYCLRDNNPTTEVE